MKGLAGQGALLLRRGSAIDFFETPLDAYDAARRTLLDLTARCFCEALVLDSDVVDVYAIKRGERGWYLKLTIDEEEPEVIVISFHPLSRPLRAVGGVVKP